MIKEQSISEILRAFSLVPYSTISSIEPSNEVQARMFREPHHV